MKRKLLSGILAMCVLIMSMSTFVFAAGESYADLQSLIAKANAIKADYYTDASYAALKAGITAAEAIGEDTTAFETESAYAKLYELMRNLIFVDGIEKKELEEITIKKSAAVLVSGVSSGSINWITGSFTMRNRTAYSNDKVSYVRFDASSLKNKKISSAKLSMSVNKVTVPANYEESTISYTIGAFPFENKEFNNIATTETLSTESISLFADIYNESNALNTATFTINTADVDAPDVTVEIDVTGYLERVKYAGNAGFLLHGINSKCSTIPGDVGLANSSVCLKVTFEDFKGQSDISKSVMPAQINSKTLNADTNFVTFLNGSASATAPQHLNSNGSSKSTFQVRARKGNNNYKRGVLVFDLSDYSALNAVTAKLKLNISAAPAQDVYLYVKEYKKAEDATIDLLTVGDLDSVIASNTDPSGTLENAELINRAAISSGTTGEITVDVSSDYVNNCLGGKLVLILTGEDQDDVSGSASNYDITFSRYGDNQPMLELSAAADYPWGKETVELVKKSDGSKVTLLDSLSETDIIGATIPKASLTDGKGGVQLVLVAYGSDKKIVAVKSASKEHYGDISGDDLSIYFDSALENEVELVKAFIWSDGLTPYFNAATAQ